MVLFGVVINSDSEQRGLSIFLVCHAVLILIQYSTVQRPLYPYSLQLASIIRVVLYCINTVLYINQSPSFKRAPGDARDLRRRTGIIPVKDSQTRIKPLALASGHGRYITVTPERTILSVGEWPLHIAVINL
jgi:hypothetical protein